MSLPDICGDFLSALQGAERDEILAAIETLKASVIECGWDDVYEYREVPALLRTCDDALNEAQPDLHKGALYRLCTLSRAIKAVNGTGSDPMMHMLCLISEALDQGGTTTIELEADERLALTRLLASHAGPSHAGPQDPLRRVLHKLGKAP